MPHVEVDGLPIFVEKIGHGPPVVLLHGFTGSNKTYRDLVYTIDRQFTTFSVDLIGHANSASPLSVEHYRMRQAVDDLVTVLKAQGHERAVWVGYSLGGRVALNVAIHRPDVVSGLVLESASPGLATEAARAERVDADEALAQRIERDGVEAFIDYWESIPLWDSQKANLNDTQKEMQRRTRLEQPRAGLANSLRGMGTGAQDWLGDRLGEISVPVLLLAGSLDTKFSAWAEEMAKRIPEATLRIIDGAGHNVHLERRDEFDETVFEFLMTVRDRF